MTATREEGGSDECCHVSIANLPPAIFLIRKTFVRYFTNFEELGNKATVIQTAQRALFSLKETAFEGTRYRKNIGFDQI